jgi:hypothetical protein
MIKFLNPKKLTEYIVEYSPEIPTNQSNKKELDTEYIKYLSILSDIYIYSIEKEKDDALIIKDKIISLLEKEKRLREEYSDPIIQAIIASFYLKKTNKNTLNLNRINAKFLKFFIYDKKEKSDFYVLWKLVTITVSNQNMFIFSNYLDCASVFSSDLLRALPYETKRGNRFKNGDNFFYFNLWLFSYLLYKKEYSFLQEVFHESRNIIVVDKIPIPYNTDEIMTVYLYFCKYSIHYDFSSDLRFSDRILLKEFELKKEWSKKLCAILFIRLLAKKTKLNFNPSDFIQDSSDCRLLIKNFDELKKDISKFLKQEKLMGTLQFLDEKDQVNFVIENLDETVKTHKKKLEEHLKDLETQDSLKEFKDKTLPEAIKKITETKIDFNNPQLIGKETSSIYINGANHVTERGVGNSCIQAEIQNSVNSAIKYISKEAKLKKYFFSNEEEIISAVEFVLSENNNLIAIVSGYKNVSKLTSEEIRFQQLFRKNNTIEISENKDSIIWLNSSKENYSHNYAIYILPKAYLPSFNLEPFTPEEEQNSVERLGLKKYEGDKEVNNLYFKVEDLSDTDNPEVRNLISVLEKEGHKDLEKSIFTSITFIGKFTYVPSTPMLCFKRYDQFTSTSIKSYVEDIKAQKKELLSFLKSNPTSEES